jgi:hypothetical protein
MSRSSTHWTVMIKYVTLSIDHLIGHYLHYMYGVTLQHCRQSLLTTTIVCTACVQVHTQIPHLWIVVIKHLRIRRNVCHRQSFRWLEARSACLYFYSSQAHSVTAGLTKPLDLHCQNVKKLIWTNHRQLRENRITVVC